MTKAMRMATEAAFFSEQLDLDVVAKLHRERRLFIGFSVPGAGIAAEICTVTLDGDPHDLVTVLLHTARAGEHLRDAALRHPNMEAAELIDLVDQERELRARLRLQALEDES